MAFVHNYGQCDINVITRQLMVFVPKMRNINSYYYYYKQFPYFALQEGRCIRVHTFLLTSTIFHEFWNCRMSL